jgi:hypothetical protein
VLYSRKSQAGPVIVDLDFVSTSNGEGRRFGDDFVRPREAVRRRDLQGLPTDAFLPVHLRHAEGRAVRVQGRRQDGLHIVFPTSRRPPRCTILRDRVLAKFAPLLSSSFDDLITRPTRSWTLTRRRTIGRCMEQKAGARSLPRQPPLSRLWVR